MYAALITSTCASISREASRTGDLAFFYYYQLDISERNIGQSLLAVEMRTLIRQAKSSNAIFSAAGFFVVDYSTLFLLANLLISNLIILLQFE